MPTPSIRPSRLPGRRVADVLGRLAGATLTGNGDTVVTGITHDSRDVRVGDVYVARAGAHTHGISHVAQALAEGASAVLTDRASVDAAVTAGAETVLAVDDPRSAAGVAAAWVYGDPAHDLLVIGITGTNGKTTTAYLVDAGLRAAGHVTGLIGTVETRVGDVVLPSARTTPEATDVHALLAVMRERGVSAVTMEVSSHALALDRVAGMTFDVAVFTNLSQDHLDFHADMDDYFATKALLFAPATAKRGVVWVGDAWGRRLADIARIPVTAVGPDDARAADWRLAEQSASAAGGRATLVGPDGGRHAVSVRLAGRFNLHNAAVAYVALIAAGVTGDDACDGIARLDAVPGRMEQVHAGQPFVALVDYAHTPDAIAALLTDARDLAAPDGHVIVVIGCGGDRDRGKRPLMGAAAAQHADIAVLTNDNPRSEDPAAILAAVAEGARAVTGGADVLVEPDRHAAIRLAVERSGAGDVLVVAGKGHEQGQEYADRTLPFDDRQVLRAELAAHGYAGVA